MPIRLKKDKKGLYYQWGETGAKYYVSEYGKEKALEKAREQERAIRASGWKGDSIMKIICVKSDAVVANQKGEYKNFTGEIDWRGTKGTVKNATFDLTSTGVYWYKGTWEKGNWKDGVWEDGIWKAGIWRDGFWEGGTWHNGTWFDGVWERGTWQNGTWIDGVWQDGTWKNGTWKNGTGKPENA